MCRRYQGLGKVMGRWTLLPSYKHHPQPVSCILIGSATKASAFTDNLNHSVVISLLIDFFLLPFWFVFSIAVGGVGGSSAARCVVLCLIAEGLFGDFV